MTRTMRGVIFVVIVIAFSCKKVYAATYTAASCSESDVSAAIASENATPVDGDIISIPTCLASANITWTTSLTSTFTHSVTIQGQGAVSATAGGSSTTGSDQTVIYNGINSQSTPLWVINTTAGKSFRITGIAYYQNSGQAASYVGGWVVKGYTQALRIDHCHFYGYQGDWLWIGGWIYGVADHNVVDSYYGTSFWMTVQNGTFWNGTTTMTGDSSWADSSHWGSNEFMFAEDNQFNSHNYPTGTWANDCSVGGRQVFRYNTFTGGMAIQAHEASGDNRGCRAGEIYMNTASVGSTQEFNTLVGTRSGSVLVWGNAISYAQHAVTLSVDRVNQNNGTFANNWAECGNGDGVNGFTGTVNTSGTSVTRTAGVAFYNGWPTESNPKIVINGTSYGIASASDPNLTLTSSAGTQTGVRFVVPAQWDGNQDATGYPCLDQPGRGQGDLLEGSFFTGSGTRENSALGTPYPTQGNAWPREAVDPVYVFANIMTWPGDSADNLVSSNANVMIDNREYYQQFGLHAEPGTFNGTAGVGQGTYSQLTSYPTCTAGPGGNTPGVGFWATDQNTLYVCNPTNTWTAYYTPYTYPHPLTQLAPAPPTNLVATPH
jgi:hypothetical protein